MKWITAIFLLFNTGFTHATAYYFSSSEGNDERTAEQASHPQTPWRSIAKYNSTASIYQPGDSILFKTGDIFTGTLHIAVSGTTLLPIYFGAYGQGIPPVISGLWAANQWEAFGNNRYKSDPAPGQNPVRLVLINNLPVPPGSFPDRSATTPFLPIHSSEGNSSVSSTVLQGQNWEGAELVIRKNRWVIDRNPVTSQTGNTLYYRSQSGYPAEKGYGFFIQQHPATLTKEGEWYFNAEDRRIEIYASETPSANEWEAAITENLVVVQHARHILLNGLHFKGTAGQIFEITAAENILVSDCLMEFAGTNAFSIGNSSGITIRSCFINAAMNNAVHVVHSYNILLLNNHITRSGIISGMGEGDSGSYEAMLLEGNDITVEANTIDSTGYIPISFRGNNIRITKNLIRYFCMVKDDGAGIYTWNNENGVPDNTNRSIDSNIVLHGVGAPAGTNDTTQTYAHGIYLDDRSANTNLLHNTVAHCANAGIYVHNAYNHFITDNTLYNNGVQLLLQHDHIAPEYPVRNLDIRENLFFSVLPDQPVAIYSSIKNDLSSFGTFSSNRYARPINKEAVIRTFHIENGDGFTSWHNLETWRKISGKDLDSKAAARGIAPYSSIEIQGSNKIRNGNFNAGTEGVNWYSPLSDLSVSTSAEAGFQGAALRLQFSGTGSGNRRSSVIVEAGPIQKEKYYLLEYEIKASDEGKSLEYFLRRSDAPYNDISTRKFHGLRQTKEKKSMVLRANADVSNGSVVFDVVHQQSPVHIDNLSLREVRATPSNPEDSLLFLHNAMPETTVYPIPGIFTDVNERMYAEQVSLPPYSSIVLQHDPYNQSLSGNLFKLSGQTKGKSIAVRVDQDLQEIPTELSIQHGISETEISTLHYFQPSEVQSGQDLLFSHDQPVRGNNYYRACYQLRNGEQYYSNTIRIFHPGQGNISEGSLSIQPNPARNTLVILIGTGVPISKSRLSLLSSSGKTIRNIPFSTSRQIRFNISQLAPGAWFIALSTQEGMVTKKFIKN